MSWVKKNIDAALSKMETSKLMYLPTDFVINEMRDGKEGDPFEDYVKWKPIKSTIELKEIMLLEQKINHTLPPSFKELLMYKFFYELHIKDHYVKVFASLPNSIKQFEINVFQNWNPNLLIKKGFIHFAYFSDFGILCFDTNIEQKDNEYPIVFFDYDDFNESYTYAENFQDFLENENGGSLIDRLNAANELLS